MGANILQTCVLNTVSISSQHEERNISIWLPILCCDLLSRCDLLCCDLLSNIKPSDGSRWAKRNCEFCVTVSRTPNLLNSFHIRKKLKNGKNSLQLLLSKYAGQSVMDECNNTCYDPRAVNRDLRLKFNALDKCSGYGNSLLGLFDLPTSDQMTLDISQGKGLDLFKLKRRNMKYSDLSDDEKIDLAYKLLSMVKDQPTLLFRVAWNKPTIAIAERIICERLLKEYGYECVRHGFMKSVENKAESLSYVGKVAESEFRLRAAAASKKSSDKLKSDLNNKDIMKGEVFNQQVDDPETPAGEDKPTLRTILQSVADKYNWQMNWEKKK